MFSNATKYSSTVLTGKRIFYLNSDRNFHIKPLAMFRPMRRALMNLCTK